jgi:NADH:ubiquinone oxidoreductase subunit 3 (subunit A)
MVYECGIIQRPLLTQLTSVTVCASLWSLPWKSSFFSLSGFQQLGASAFFSMVMFIAILLFGLLYARMKGVLRWG